MIQNSIKDNIENEYFNWMYHLVCNDKQYNKLSFKKLLYFLHDVEFFSMMDMDDNRREDGIEFRYRFGYENGYSDEFIKRYLDVRECSVLEMMIALSFKVEEQIMDNLLYGDRTGQWFWTMIANLGLGKMDDANFNKDICFDIIDRFLFRKYDPDGKGGLFTIKNYKQDLREVDIWCQFMWYLNEIDV